MKITFLITILLFAFTSSVNARLPEPDNIIYGVAGVDAVPFDAGDTNVTIQVSVDGRVLASYTMGENSTIADRYILRVPMDVLTPADPNAAREGDLATVSTLVSGVESAQTSVTLGAPSTVTVLHLGGASDHDGDGVADGNDPDADNDGVNDGDDLCPTGVIGWVSNGATDNDADGCRDSDEDPDDDNDGYSDAQELAAGSNPLDPSSDPTTVAARGDANSDGEINAVDVLLCTRIAVQLAPYNAACDVIGDDNAITVSDLLIIQRTAWGNSVVVEARADSNHHAFHTPHACDADAAASILRNAGGRSARCRQKRCIAEYYFPALRPGFNRGAG